MLEAQVTSILTGGWGLLPAYVCLDAKQANTPSMDSTLNHHFCGQPRLLVCPSNPICSPGILRFSAPNAAEVRVRTPVKLGESLCFMRCPTVQASDSS